MTTPAAAVTPQILDLDALTALADAAQQRASDADSATAGGLEGKNVVTVLELVLRSADDVPALAAAVKQLAAELREARALPSPVPVELIRAGRFDPPADTPETRARLAGYDGIACPKCGGLRTMKHRDKLLCEDCERTDLDAEYEFS